MLDKQSRISSTVRVADAPPRRQAPPADPCAMVVFGASGDLTKRLVVPALYNLARTKLLPGGIGGVYDEFSGCYVCADEPATWSLSTQMPQDRSMHEVVLTLPPLPPK